MIGHSQNNHNFYPISVHTACCRGMFVKRHGFILQLNNRGGETDVMKWAGNVECHICAPVRHSYAVEGAERVACETHKPITCVKKDYCIWYS